MTIPANPENRSWNKIELLSELGSKYLPKLNGIVELGTNVCNDSSLENSSIAMCSSLLQKTVELKEDVDILVSYVLKFRIKN